MVSTRQSILGGERVNLDALNAEQQLYTTRRDLARTRYDYLMAWIKLHYYAGTLNEQDLAQVDEAFGQGADDSENRLEDRQLKRASLDNSNKKRGNTHGCV